MQRKKGKCIFCESVSKQIICCNCATSKAEQSFKCRVKAEFFRLIMQIWEDYPVISPIVFVNNRLFIDYLDYAHVCYLQLSVPIEHIEGEESGYISINENISHIDTMPCPITLHKTAKLLTVSAGKYSLTKNLNTLGTFSVVQVGKHNETSFEISKQEFSDYLAFLSGEGNDNLRFEMISETLSLVYDKRRIDGIKVEYIRKLNEIYSAEYITSALKYFPEGNLTIAYEELLNITCTDNKYIKLKLKLAPIRPNS